MQALGLVKQISHRTLHVDLIQMLTQWLVQSRRARRGFACAIPLREQLVKAFSQDGTPRRFVRRIRSRRSLKIRLETSFLPSCSRGEDRREYLSAITKQSFTSNLELDPGLGFAEIQLGCGSRLCEEGVWILLTNSYVMRCQGTDNFLARESLLIRQEREENLFDTGAFGYILTSQYVLYVGGTYLERRSIQKSMTRTCFVKMFLRHEISLSEVESGVSCCRRDLQHSRFTDTFLGKFTTLYVAEGTRRPQHRSTSGQTGKEAQIIKFLDTVHAGGLDGSIRRSRYTSSPPCLMSVNSTIQKSAKPTNP